MTSARTFTDSNLIIGGRYLLDLLREPGTNSDPQVHVVMVAPTKAHAIKTLDYLGCRGFARLTFRSARRT